MSAFIRLILIALLGLAAAPAAEAQCIRTPGAFGTNCTLGAPPIVTGRPPPRIEFRPPQRPAFQPIPIPEIRQPESRNRRVPTIPLSPAPSPGVAGRCVTLYGACVISGGVIPGGACTCGRTTGTAR